MSPTLLLQFSNSSPKVFIVRNYAVCKTSVKSFSAVVDPGFLNSGSYSPSPFLLCFHLENIQGVGSDTPGGAHMLQSARTKVQAPRSHLWGGVVGGSFIRVSSSPLSFSVK